MLDQPRGCEGYIGFYQGNYRGYIGIHGDKGLGL